MPGRALTLVDELNLVLGEPIRWQARFAKHILELAQQRRDLLRLTRSKILCNATRVA